MITGEELLVISKSGVELFQEDAVEVRCGDGEMLMEGVAVCLAVLGV